MSDAPQTTEGSKFGAKLLEALAEAAAYARGETTGVRVHHRIVVDGKAYHPSELPEHLKEAIRNATMDPRHEHLNALLDAEEPADE